MEPASLDSWRAERRPSSGSRTKPVRILDAIRLNRFKISAEGVKHLLPLIVLLSTTLPATAAPGSIADVWAGLSPDRPHPAVVRVVVSEGQTMSLGSGTLVATRGRHGLVVTNWHVVRDARGPINVIFPDGFRSGASLLGTDADWDLAALAIWRPNAEPVRLARHAPQLDDELAIAGYGSGTYRSASGRCVQYISPGSNHPFEMLELSASARDGDSGGPIFNVQGELAGVLFGAARGRTAGSFCGRVREFLNSVSPRFDALSTPSTDTMIAQDLPAPAVVPESITPDRDTPVIGEVAMVQPRTATDYAWEPWEPTVDEAPETTRTPPRPRPLPLASIPAPVIDPPTHHLSDPPSDRRADVMFPVRFPLSPGSSAVLSSNPTTPATKPASKEAALEWTDIAGSSGPEQVKNFLAAFGLVAIIFQVLRVFSTLQGQTRTRRRRSPARRRRQQPVRRRVVRRVRSW